MTTVPLVGAHGLHGGDDAGAVGDAMAAVRPKASASFTKSGRQHGVAA